MTKHQMTITKTCSHFTLGLLVFKISRHLIHAYMTSI